MLWVLHAGRNRSPIRNLARYAGRGFRRRVRTLGYDVIRRRARLPGGAYLFADLDLLAGEALAFVRRIADRVRPRAPILNDPARALGRFDLLERLHAEGINSYRAYRGGTPQRWPVFLRDEFDHRGPRTALLPDAGALREARAAASGKWIAVEFADTRCDDGLYRKYAACRVGERIFARHLFFDTDWVVKMRAEAPADLLAEERSYVESFPDRESIRRVFDLAGIEYGRIDFSRTSDGVEVWEINTNPTIINHMTRTMRNRWPLNVEVIGRHVEAMLELARTGEGRPAIPLNGIEGIRPFWWRS